MDGVIHFAILSTSKSLHRRMYVMSPLVTYLIGCIGLIIKPGPDLL